VGVAVGVKVGVAYWALKWAWQAWALGGVVNFFFWAWQTFFVSGSVMGVRVGRGVKVGVSNFFWINRWVLT